MKTAWPCGILMVALALPGAVRAESNPLVLEEKVQDIVAWVNDDVILWTDLQENEQAAIQQLMQQKSSAGGDLAQQIEEIKESVLLRAIWDRLMVQEAERLFDMESIKKDILDRFMKSKGIGSMEELDKMLKQYYMTREELTDRLVTSAAPEFVLDQQVRANLGVSADEARKFYDEHRDYFTTPGSVVFREILIKDSDGSKQAQAEEVVRQAREEGADFEKLVEKYSEAPSKALGGKIGPVNPRDLFEQVSKIVTSIDVGSVSDPFRTPQGWLIVKVEERVDAETKPFEQVEKDCEEGCRNARFEPAFKKFIQGLWDNSTIEVRKEYADRIPEPWRDSIILR